MAYPLLHGEMEGECPWAKEPCKQRAGDNSVPVLVAKLAGCLDGKAVLSVNCGGPGSLEGWMELHRESEAMASSGVRNGSAQSCLQVMAESELEARVCGHAGDGGRARLGRLRDSE